MLEPVFHRAIWGGNRLAKFIRDCPDDLAHLYLVSDRKGMSNHILNTDMDLKELFIRKKKVWKMENFSEFPLTIALVDASQNLSIQVHPDADIAHRLEGVNAGKKESWYFLEPPRFGWIYGGCDCTAIEDIKEIIRKGEIESVLSRIKIAQGDCVCVRAGSIHALTAGSLVYEVEFGNEFTYRFYDYGRSDKNCKPRRLDVDNALAALVIRNKPEFCRVDSDGWIREKEYELRVIRDISYYRNESDRLECFSVIRGEGLVEGCHLNEPIAVLLEPGEELKKVNINFAISARLGRQNEH